MSEVVSKGYLVLADISGYTSYLAGVELEHSHDILADLLGLITDRLCPPLRLAKLEGDAVFCFLPASERVDGEALLGALTSAYLAFARRRRTVALSSSCTCEACRRTPELDLKFCVHRGSFVEHEVAGSRELVGSDVILAHRLLKNSVAERHGLRGYALLTDACGELLTLDELPTHREHYDDIGEVDCRLIDLTIRWEEQGEGARNVVSREQASFVFESDVAASPQAVWSAMTDPAHGMRWRVGVDDIRERHRSASRGVGTVTHCVHGRTTIEQEIVDWLPPHHVSFSERNPIGLCLWTMSLAPLEQGARTHLEWRIALRGGRRQALMMRLLSGRLRHALDANFKALLDYLAEAGSKEAAPAGAPAGEA